MTHSTNNSGKLDESVNPDRLALSKKDVLEFLEAVERRWRKNKKDNILYIGAIKGVIAMTHLTPESAIKAFWAEVFRFYEFLQRKNAFAIAKEGGEGWAKILEQGKTYMEFEV